MGDHAYKVRITPYGSPDPHGGDGWKVFVRRDDDESIDRYFATRFFARRFGRSRRRVEREFARQERRDETEQFTLAGTGRKEEA